MSKASNFLAWLLEDINDVSAEVGTPRDAQLKEFAADGYLKLYDSHHGMHFYALTGKRAEGTTLEQHNANAILIAAAPDMLALLREGLCAAQLDDWRQRVASVIAKAEGPQTASQRGDE